MTFKNLFFWAIAAVSIVLSSVAFSDPKTTVTNVPTVDPFIADLCRAASQFEGAPASVGNGMDRPNLKAEQALAKTCNADASLQSNRLNRFGLVTFICQRYTGKNDPLRRNGCYSVANLKLGSAGNSHRLKACGKHLVNTSAATGDLLGTQKRVDCYHQEFLRLSREDQPAGNNSGRAAD